MSSGPVNHAPGVQIGYAQRSLASIDLKWVQSAIAQLLECKTGDQTFAGSRLI